MKSSIRRSLVLSLLALTGVSVVVAQNFPMAGKQRAHRRIHHHDGPSPHAGWTVG